MQIANQHFLFTLFHFILSVHYLTKLLLNYIEMNITCISINKMKSIDVALNSFDS